jgi:hypothetical protein
MSLIRRLRMRIAFLLGLYWLVLSSGCSETPETSETRSGVVAEKILTAGREIPTEKAAAEDRPAASADQKPLSAPSQADSEKTIKTEVALGRGARPAGGHSKTQEISFDDLTFKMEKEESFQRSMLTDKIVAYAGKPVRLRGFMLPSFKQDGLTEFVLVRDNMECCFGPGAALYDCVMVRMRSGKSASFSVRPITLEGVFSIDAWRDFDGVVRAIYHLDGISVK